MSGLASNRSVATVSSSRAQPVPSPRRASSVAATCSALARSACVAPGDSWNNALGNAPRSSFSHNTVNARPDRVIEPRSVTSLVVVIAVPVPDHGRRVRRQLADELTLVVGRQHVPAVVFPIVVTATTWPGTHARRPRGAGPPTGTATGHGLLGQAAHTAGPPSAGPQTGRTLRSFEGATRTPGPAADPPRRAGRAAPGPPRCAKSAAAGTPRRSLPSAQAAGCAEPAARAAGRALAAGIPARRLESARS